VWVVTGVERCALAISAFKLVFFGGNSMVMFNRDFSPRPWARLNRSCLMDSFGTLQADGTKSGLEAHLRIWRRGPSSWTTGGRGRSGERRVGEERRAQG